MKQNGAKKKAPNDSMKQNGYSVVFVYVILHCVYITIRNGLTNNRIKEIAGFLNKIEK